jgi:predicted nucleic acid-binding protein
MTRSSADEQPALLDTNILIHGERLARESIPAVSTISTISIAELSAGVNRASDPDERARRLETLQRAESVYDPLPFDLAAARAYGRIAAAVSAMGRSPRSRVADQMIAAIALANDLVVCTTNEADYAGLEDIVGIVAIPRPTG